LEQESKDLKETAKKAEENGVAGAKDEGAAANDAEDEKKAVEDEEESADVEKRANAAAIAGDKASAEQLNSEAKEKKKEAMKNENQADAKLKADSEAAAEESDSAAAEAEQKLDEAENAGNKTDAEIEELKKDAESKREVSSKMADNAKEARAGGDVASEEEQSNKKLVAEKMKKLAEKKAEAEKAAAAGDARKADKLEKEAKGMELDMKREQQKLVEDAVNAKAGKLEAETQKLKDSAKLARKQGQDALAERIERKAIASEESANDQREAAESSTRASLLAQVAAEIKKEAEGYKKKNDTEAFDKLMKEASTKMLESQLAEMEGQAKVNKKMVNRTRKSIEILEKVIENSEDQVVADAYKKEVANQKEQLKVRETAMKEASKTLASLQDINDAVAKVDDAVANGADNKTITKLKADQQEKEKKLEASNADSEKDLSEADEASEKLEDNSTNAEKLLSGLLESAREGGNLTEVKRLEELQKSMKRVIEDAMMGLPPKNNSKGKGGHWWEHWDRNDTEKLIPFANKMIDEVHTVDPGVVQQHVEKSNQHHKKALEHYEKWKNGETGPAPTGATGMTGSANSNSTSSNTDGPATAADHKPFKKIEGEKKPQQ